MSVVFTKTMQNAYVFVKGAVSVKAGTTKTGEVVENKVSNAWKSGKSFCFA